jgi:chromosome segregation ATPase
MTVSTAVLAESKALDRAQYMIRQLNAQKMQLEQQKAQLKAELEQLRKESEKQLKQQKAGNQKLDQANRKKSEHIQKLRDKLKETVVALRQSESERLNANRMNQSMDSELRQCVTNNQKLVELNAELLQRYHDKGFWASLSQAEPFTRLDQVEIENLLQEYRFQNEDLQVRQQTRYEQFGNDESSAPEQDTDG